MALHSKFETEELNAPEIRRQALAFKDRETAASRRRLFPNRSPLARGVLLLLASVASAEVASNVVYVVLVEKAYQLGDGVTAIGIVLILQAAAQVIFGSWAGEEADRRGFRKTAVMSALLTIPLLLALAFAQNNLLVYAVAFLLMFVRSLLIPARFGLIAQLSEKSRLAEANTAVLILAGAGSFIGPAIAAALLITTDDFGLPLLVGGLGWLLSIPSLFLIQVEDETPVANLRLSFTEEVRTGWRLIGKRITIKQVLTCLLIASFFLGAITPLFTPLSRQLGLGSEGTGIFFSALGLGYLIGPVIATALFKRIRLSASLLVSGLLAPIGLMLIGTLEHLAGVLMAIVLVSTAGAGVNVIVTTITQRLTPPDHRGSVLGTEQTLIGLAWIVSLGAVTGLTAVWENESIVRPLFVIIGSVGFLSILSCWLWNQRPSRAACELCEPRFRLASAVCWAMRGVPSGISGAACGVICGKDCRCC